MLVLMYRQHKKALFDEEWKISMLAGAILSAKWTEPVNQPTSFT
jgi:hypothetical protein